MRKNMGLGIISFIIGCIPGMVLFFLSKLWIAIVATIVVSFMVFFSIKLVGANRVSEPMIGTI